MPDKRGNGAEIGHGSRGGRRKTEGARLAGRSRKLGLARKSGARMAIKAGARLAVACFAMLALAGCVAGTKPKDAAGDAATGRAVSSPVSVARDVEAPQVFNVKGQGLWDGRPSLGGVWVAHASVKDPERVIIRNAKNGKSVVGALFRRERDLPGPGLQVSSDAAEALGLLAGQPTELVVVALRREEKPVPADAEIGAEDTATDVAADGSTAATSEGAAVQPATEVAAAAADAGATGAAAPTPDTSAVSPAATSSKKSGGLFGFLKKKPKASQPEAGVVAAGAGPGAIEQTTLDPVASSAAAAIDRAEAAAAAPSSTALPAAPAALSRSYIQIGIFSTEANANRASAQMKAAGMTATVRPDESAGKTYWRVIVGPAASVSERDALVAKVKGIGYPDAYPVAN